MGFSNASVVTVQDIRRDKSEKSLLEDLQRSLKPTNNGSKAIPTLLLYDEKGLKLFEEITYLEEYYLTNAEIETLNEHAAEIVARVPGGSRLVELGSGNLRKVNILLEAFEKAKKDIEYYALDLSLSELHRTFAHLDAASYHHVSFNALHGTYDDALVWLAETRNQNQSTCVITLGSSIGNFGRLEAAKFLESFKDVLGPADSILVGLDGCQDTQRVFAAYNDSKGVTEKFYRNGLDHANKLLGNEAFRQDEWAVNGAYDEQIGKHHASYVALKDINIKDFSFQKGEKIHLEDAFKYSDEQSDHLWHSAGLILQMVYENVKMDYRLYFLSPCHIQFSGNASDYASRPLPSLNDWQSLWTAWDTVTKAMVPRDELLNKPIKLRNNLIFYLGHTPAFADINFVKATAAKPIDPAWYSTIFERGIDPDVDNPDICHAHSEIPDTWPPLAEILSYQNRVRERIAASIVSGQAYHNRKLSRALWLCFEHEAMHLETFLYMLLQSERVLPPPGSPKPDFEYLAHEAKQARVENKWHHVPSSKVKLGLDDPETDLGPDRFFGWDVERPARNVSVQAFEAQGRPISNGEYAHFLELTRSEILPASWIRETSMVKPKMNGFSSTNHANWFSQTSDVLKLPSSAFMVNKAVRTVYGPVPLQDALDWPVMASYNELQAYATWAGGRIPSLEEIKSIYNYVEASELGLEQVPSTLISAVNGHLCNEGVQETPPSHQYDHHAAKGIGTGPNPNELFVDLTAHNVGFKHWHPTPVTDKGMQLSGQGNAGGLWEWTSTPLAAFEGYKPMDLYPGYSADFFDDKHNICVGGSWATVPRIAGRKSFVNWYQRNYPFVWCTARLVRDVV